MKRRDRILFLVCWFFIGWGVAHSFSAEASAAFSCGWIWAAPTLFMVRFKNSTERGHRDGVQA